MIEAPANAGVSAFLGTAEHLLIPRRAIKLDTRGRPDGPQTVTNRANRGEGMMPTRRNDRRVSGHRRWFRGFPVVAGLCSLALVAPATSAAKNSVSTSVTADPGCGFVSVSGTWNPVPGQAYVGVDLSENQTGLTLSST